MNNFSEIYKILADAPDNQISEKLRDKFLDLSEENDYDPMDILDILNKCIHGSLASDFAMQALYFIFEDMCKSKNINIEDIRTPINLY